jgi:hypothetical protein
MTSPDRPGTTAADLDTTRPNIARAYDYLLVRHEALRDRVEVKDLCRWAVAAA